ncbi:hybrid sensor histidine kinase/response regulator [Noviherbaspirillum aridicola]|uniref:histidine kinase n=1 Tax=Noviherbaspirillum aridicola TaxID=2849687 RepID=A0ABQ4Q310_9BURK|nr:response regulator [Noviherbaspirillum aridicola]GIZ51578.1 PAS domain-containing sensor histidine kinase [Noviherbaspirillum aridicola]
MDTQASHPPHILIVEDSPTQAGKLRYLLEGKGYKTRIASNGRKALEAIRESQPALVLSDIIMPELDGYGLCRAIKTDPALGGVPVLLVTSLSDAQDIVRGLECGADNLVRKPYEDDYLLQRIAQTLASARRRRDGRNEAGGADDLFLDGVPRPILADKQQMLDLLVSTYEQAVHVNGQLRAREREVNELNATLAQHAAQLEATNREIGRQNLELEHASRMKSEFLVNMSHELRTPLNAIIGFSDALKNGLLGPVAAEQADALGDIHESGRHLLSLINDILDLSKIEAGKMDLEPEALDIRQLLQGCVSVVREKAAAGRLHLRLELEPVGWVMLDGRKTRQLVYNLLSNAIKFTPPGGAVTLRMCLREGMELGERRILAGVLSPERRYLTIAVQDNGIGIGEEDIGKLCQPFVQLDGGLARKYEGTGLGLSLVRQMVELQGGLLTLASRPGAGSEFVLWLPFEAAGTAAARG